MDSLENLAVLSPEFYARSPLAVARELIGKILVHRSEAGLSAGRIVECEAYLGRGDPASHASRGRTPRNGVMFGPPGVGYVYFNYGMHHLFNVVADEPGKAGAVLIRAVEPLAGLELMTRRRGREDPLCLCSGPGKLAQAFDITDRHNGFPVTSGPLTVRWAEEVPNEEIKISSRIGISDATERLWRFFMAANPHVSQRSGPITRSAKVLAELSA